MKTYSVIQKWQDTIYNVEAENEQEALEKAEALAVNDYPDFDGQEVEEV